MWHCTPTKVPAVATTIHLLHSSPSHVTELLWQGAHWTLDGHS
jgi:hypothetical protein